jgi:micrococcal nuclease
MNRPSSRLRWTATALALLLWSSMVLAQPLHGKVIRVLDGDTLDILTPEHEQIRVRLAWIDAPEKGQAFGSRAREHLADLCAGVDAQVLPTGTDRYGRTLAEVDCLGLEANQTMVSSGLAWVYRPYTAGKPQQHPLSEREALARAASLGLWSDPHAMAPWVWRRAQRPNR